MPPRWRGSPTEPDPEWVAGRRSAVDLDSEDGSFHGPGFTGHLGFDRAALAGEAQAAGFQDIDFSTVYHVSKPESAGQTDFPIFLMVARK